MPALLVDAKCSSVEKKVKMPVLRSARGAKATRVQQRVAARQPSIADAWVGMCWPWQALSHSVLLPEYALGYTAILFSERDIFIASWW